MDTKIKLNKFFLPGIVILSGMGLRAFLSRGEASEGNFIKRFGKQLYLPVALGTLCTTEGLFNFLGDQDENNFNVEKLLPVVAAGAVVILGSLRDAVGFSIESGYALLVAIKQFKGINIKKLIKE